MPHETVRMQPFHSALGSFSFFVIDLVIYACLCVALILPREDPFEHQGYLPKP